MILKKPYAFLIKYFRIIHLMLLLPIGYLINKSLKIVSFFRSYVSNNYSTNMINIAAEHINFFMYLAVILIIGVVIAIYYLMRQKEKSTKLYFFTLLYYILLFILIGLTYNVLSGMERDVISAQTARAYRDVSFVLCLPQYLFFVYVLIRGIGFDIKQFNFANDLKDLEITDVDSEEFEFSVNVDSYKIKRNIRRFIREFIYYVKENLFVFSCIIVVIIITFGTMLYLHFEVYNKTYKVTDRMTHNFFNIGIKDSILTNIGYNGKKISEGKYFLALQLEISNRTLNSQELDYNNFRLVVNDENIYPTLDRGEYFIDFGKPYHQEQIKGQTTETYSLVYELTENQIKNEYEIKILESLEYGVGEITPHYKIINIKPRKVLEISDVENYDLGKIINFKDSNIGYTTFKVNNYQLTNNYTYNYNECYTNNNCVTLKDMITPDKTMTIEKTTLLVLNIEYNFDNTTIYANNIKNSNKFFDDFLSIEYIKNNEKKLLSLKNRTTKYMTNTVIYELREDVNNADSINLLVTIRNKRYTIKLK